MDYCTIPSKINNERTGISLAFRLNATAYCPGCSRRLPNKGIKFNTAVGTCGSIPCWNSQNTTIVCERIARLEHPNDVTIHSGLKFWTPDRVFEADNTYDRHQQRHHCTTLDLIMNAETLDLFHA